MQINHYLRLMRFDRPIGTLLLLWPTLIALFLTSNGFPDLNILIIFVAGVVIMRAAGCVINDIADRNVDGQVQRTKNRPLAIGVVPVRNACILFFVLLGIALFLASWLNWPVICLAVIAAGLTVLYPFAKRFTYYPQFILGLAFSWSIPMVYMQIQGNVGIETWLVFFSIMAWVVAYDTQYALADKEDDLKAGIKSTAIAFGSADKFIIFSLQCCTLLGFCLIGYYHNFSKYFYLILILSATLTIYQQVLIKGRVPVNCLRAFLNNNYFGMLIFIAVLVGIYTHQ